MAKLYSHLDEVDWLVSIYKTSENEELRKESHEKLLSLGLDEIQIDKRFGNFKSEEDELKAFNKAWAKQLERNQFESYSLFERDCNLNSVHKKQLTLYYG